MACLLVVDDEERVRATIAKHLTRNGHAVLEASNGTQALQLLEEAPVDLIVADIYMPEMDGVELATRVIQRALPVKILAVSGGGFAKKEDVLAMAQRLGAVRTLAKPFSSEELLSAVDGVLGGH